MQPVDSFRTLIVLAFSTFALAFFASFSAPLPGQVYPYIQWEGYGATAPFWISEIFYYSFVALDVAGLLLCFFFVRNAHLLLLASILFSPLQVAFNGISITMPLYDTFWTIHFIFYVLVVGMAMYDPNISQRLRAKDAECGSAI